MVPGIASASELVFSCASATTAETARGATAVAAVATPAAPMWDRNDLRLNFPSEDIVSFVSFSSTAKFHLPIQLCSEYKKASLGPATSQLVIDRRQINKCRTF